MVTNHQNFFVPTGRPDVGTSLALEESPPGNELKRESNWGGTVMSKKEINEGEKNGGLSVQLIRGENLKRVLTKFEDTTNSYGSEEEYQFLIQLAGIVR